MQIMKTAIFKQTHLVISSILMLLLASLAVACGQREVKYGIPPDQIIQDTIADDSIKNQDTAIQDTIKPHQNP